MDPSSFAPSLAPVALAPPAASVAAEAPKRTRTPTPEYLSLVASGLPPLTDPAVCFEDTALIITSSPRAPGSGTSSRNTSRKCFDTPRKVRSSASAFLRSKISIKSRIFDSATSCSFNRARKSSLWRRNSESCSMAARTLTTLEGWGAGVAAAERRWEASLDPCERAPGSPGKPRSLEPPMDSSCLVTSVSRRWMSRNGISRKAGS
mmetsp:Transcript_16883/g.30623  ORF Transcript_16883/g.30623 Transcript_16883/m.30623 type:complete len:206 (+) Transcript_16883:642-1259(+)